MAQTIEQALQRLARSKFRSRFHLNNADFAYLERHGLEQVQTHAVAFVKTRLAPAAPLHDGRQTPWRGHPVFVAQHACACCCRGCLQHVWHVPIGVELSAIQQEKIVRLLMAWILRELQVHKGPQKAIDPVT